MAIPDYQTLMLPLLKMAKERGECHFLDVIECLATEFNVSEAERQELLPSGAQPIFVNRVSWARTYLKKAGLLQYPKRGFVNITTRGQEVLTQNPNRIDNKFLRQFTEFLSFQNIQLEQASITTNETNTLLEVSAVLEKTPEEALAASYLTIRNSLATEIIEKVKSCSSSFFERLVVELLVKMGYGGTLQDAGRAIGRSGDGGIDGIIKEDRLGLDAIYLQAKRWEGNVSRPEVQKFAGALQGQRARKGVFITTSDFTKDAREYVAFIESKIILINGDELAQLMIDYNVGVSNAAVYEIKKIDSDYFTEE